MVRSQQFSLPIFSAVMINGTIRWHVALWLVATALVGCGRSAAAPWTASWADSAVLSTVAAGETKEPAAEPEPAGRHTANKAVVASIPAGIPRVLLSAGHAKLCRVGVGDSMPALKLPRLGGQVTPLADLYGKQATVVLFWQPDRWMARTALADLARDVVKRFDPQQMSVVGIAVGQPAGAVQAVLNRTPAAFPQLLDTNGGALAAVGSVALPRLYVLDAQGTIVWFDIEYSEATRRELQQTLRVLTAEKK